MRPSFGSGVLLSLCFGSIGRADVLYVDAAATGNNNGKSWCHAFVKLQDALTLPMQVGKTDREIRVAQGTHKPDQGGGNVTLEKTASFFLTDGLTLLGGFAGCTGDDPDARDFREFPTILSGDLAGNDGINFANYSDNSIHVVNASDLLVPTTLDGFTITGGNGDGGGLFIRGGSKVQVSNCVFRLNTGAYGGALFIGASDAGADVLDCLFLGNKGNNGGALFSVGEVTVERSLFAANRASFGGAALVGEGGNMVFRQCAIAANAATSSGGAIFGGRSTTLDLDRCRVIGNQSDSGGAFWGFEVRFTFTNSLFHGNVATTAGGAIFASDCFEDREILNTSIIGNSAELGGGMYGDSCPYPDSYALINSILWSNQAMDGSQLALDGCEFANDQFHVSYTDIEGGQAGIHLGQGWNLVFGAGNDDRNPDFLPGPVGTWSQSATYDSQSFQTVLHNDDMRWIDDALIGKLLVTGSSPLAFLIAGNTKTTLTVWGDASQFGQSGAAYSIFNPRLAGTSPCIDVGTGAASFGDRDLDDRARVLGPGADLGAYEFGDCDKSNVLDVEEIADGTVEDCDGNDVPDSCDLTDGLTEDCTLNGIPDQCEADLACDTDGDGVDDEDDECPDSDVSPTISIGSCQTDVENLMVHEGCSMADELGECSVQGKRPLQYIRCVVQLTRRWRAGGLITFRERVQLIHCFLRAED